MLKLTRCVQFFGINRGSHHNISLCQELFNQDTSQRIVIIRVKKVRETFSMIEYFF